MERPSRSILSPVLGLDEDGRIVAFKEKPKPEEVLSHWVNAGLLLGGRIVLRLGFKLVGGRRYSPTRVLAAEVDLWPAIVSSPGAFSETGEAMTVTVQAVISNIGTISTTEDIVVLFYDDSDTQIGSDQIISGLGCCALVDFPTLWYISRDWDLPC